MLSRAASRPACSGWPSSCAAGALRGTGTSRWSEHLRDPRLCPNCAQPRQIMGAGSGSSPGPRSPLAVPRNALVRHSVTSARADRGGHGYRNAHGFRKAVSCASLPLSSGSVEEAVRGSGHSRGPRAAPAPRRESEAEDPGGRSHARQDDPPGGARKKVLTPSRRRVAIAWAQQAYQLSQRRACRALGAVR